MRHHSTMADLIRSSGDLDIPLLRWQREALDKWIRHGGRGIIEAATGSGKTRVGLGAIRVAQSVWQSDLVVVIVVPTKVLLYQWEERLHRWITPHVALLGDGHSARSRDRMIVAVINSARSQLPELLLRWRRQHLVTLLVVDECHRAGAPTNARIFDGPIDFSLGLSATPEREGDSATEQILRPNLGEIIVRYGRSEAEKDGVIAPVDLIDVVVQLDRYELNDYYEISEHIKRTIGLLLRSYPELERRRQDLLKAIGDLKRKQAKSGRVDEFLTDWTRLVMKRRRLLANARERPKALAFLLENLENSHQAFLFHEQIRQAEATAGKLRSMGRSVEVYHSEMKSAQRDAVIRRFREGSTRWISCVKALDEGIDIPAATTAVIVSGTFSRRQLIQRLGRVSRDHGNTRAIAYRISTEEEMKKAPVAASMHGRVRWPDESDLLTRPALVRGRLEPASDWLDDLDWYYTEDDTGLTTAGDPEPPRWSNSVDAVRNLTIPIADRIIGSSLGALIAGTHVPGPRRAVQSAAESVQDAVLQRGRLRQILDGDPLADWELKLTRELSSIDRVLSADGAEINPVELHSNRTRIRHLLKRYDDAVTRDQLRKDREAKAYEERRKASLSPSVRSKIEDSLSSGNPIEVYVNDVADSVALVSIRRTLIQAELVCPPDDPPHLNDILLARVQTFDPDEVQVTLTFAGRPG